MSDRDPTLELSRRSLLRGAALIGGAVAACAGAPAAMADSKLAQAAARYQPTPKGNAHCGNCAHWQAPASCQLVQGPLSPSGWCLLYAPKG